MMPTNQTWLTVTEVRLILGCSRQHVYRLYKDGALRATRRYGRIVFRASDVRNRAQNPPPKGRPKKG